MKKKIITTAAIFGAVGVVAGAFGAHGLETKLKPADMEIWRTAVQYQFYHAFALLALATVTRLRTKLIINVYYLFTTGIIMFSGSLYILACRELITWSWIPDVMGAVTPLGGVLFIAGWITFAVAARKIK
jgi:uncharacterized membrane protein YgdD (TMEM256/DUF423 family)